MKCHADLTLISLVFSVCFVIFNMCLSTVAHTTARLTSTSCAKLRLRLFELVLVNAQWIANQASSPPSVSVAQHGFNFFVSCHCFARRADHLGNLFLCEHFFNSRGFSAEFEQQIRQPGARRLW